MVGCHSWSFEEDDQMISGDDECIEQTLFLPILNMPKYIIIMIRYMLKNTFTRDRSTKVAIVTSQRIHLSEGIQVYCTIVYCQ